MTFDNTQRMLERLSKGNVIGGVESYVKSIPETIILANAGKAILNASTPMLSKVAVSIGSKSFTGASLAKLGSNLIDKSLKWYTAPAMSVVKSTAPKVVAPLSKGISVIAPPLALLALIDTVLSVTGQASLTDYASAPFSQSAKEKVNKQINSSLTWQEAFFNAPMAIFKMFRKLGGN